MAMSIKGAIWESKTRGKMTETSEVQLGHISDGRGEVLQRE